MKNCMLLYPNRVDSTFYTVSFSEGSWLVGLPLTNLRERLVGKVARSTSLLLGHTRFRIDLGAEVDTRAIAIAHTNISRDGLIRVRAAHTDDGFGSPILDTGWVEYWTVIYPHGQLPYGHPSWWDGRIEAERAAGYPMPFFRDFGALVNARHWYIQFDDQANPDGYVEVGRVFLAPGWQPTRNMDYGTRLGWITATRRDEALDGARYFDRRDPRRRMLLTINNLSIDEALTWPFEMLRQQGIDGQVFFAFDPDDVEHMHRRAFVATIAEPSALEYPYHDANGVSFVLEEEI